MRKIFLKISIAVLLLAGLSAIFLANIQAFLLNPFSTALTFELPLFSAADDQGNQYLIDRSLKRVTKTSPTGELIFEINGGQRERGSFYFADEVASDAEGFVYILNRIMDPPGFYIVATEILRYTPEGQFDRVLYRKDYPADVRQPSLIQKAQFLSLGAEADRVRWFDTTGDGLDLYTIKADGTDLQKIQVLPGIPADLLISSADLLPDGSVVYISKKGLIEKKSVSGNITVLYDVSKLTGEVSTPWRLKTDKNGRIFFTDLETKAIRQLLPDGTAPAYFNLDILKQQGFAEVAESYYYSLSGSNSGILSTCGPASGAFFINPEGKITKNLTTADYRGSSIWVHFLLWGLLVLGALVFFYILWVIYVDGFQRKIPPFLKTVSGVIFLTVAVGFLVTSMILNNFNQRYTSEVMSKINQLVHLVPRLIDADQLTSIQDPAQFGGEAYSQIRKAVIDAIYGETLTENNGLYFALHRVKGERLYTFMYLNGDTAMYHPFDYLMDPTGIYQAALKGESQSAYSNDAWGSWMYSTGPIKTKSGEIVGVFEMGGDFYSFTQENNRLIQTLLINILTILVIFILLMVEGTFLSDQMRKKNQTEALAEKGVDPRRSEDRFFKTYLVRPLSVLFFTSASMSLLFLPLMMKNFYQPLFGLPENVVYGLPISLRLFFFGLGTILAGSLTSKIGWKKVFYLGLALSTVGLIGAGAATEMILFLSSSVFIGLGAGFATIGMRSFINMEADDEIKSNGYSHFYSGIIAGTNVGVIAGSWLADIIGYSYVFYLSVVLTIATALICLRLFPKSPQDKPSVLPAAVKGKFSGLFVFRPQVLSFFLFIIIPIYAASMFLYFFMPVFAGAQGVTNADIGRIFLLNGLIIIYVAPSFNRFLRKYMGVPQYLLVSSLIWIAALVPFILMGDMTGVIISVIIMGLAEGTAVVAQNGYFLNLESVKEIGQDKAVGFFEVMGKAGETIAPILIGFAMLLGPQWGIAVIAGGLGVTLLFFLASQAMSRKTAV